MFSSWEMVSGHRRFTQFGSGCRKMWWIYPVIFIDDFSFLYTCVCHDFYRAMFYSFYNTLNNNTTVRCHLYYRCASGGVFGGNVHLPKRRPKPNSKLAKTSAIFENLCPFFEDAANASIGHADIGDKNYGICLRHFCNTSTNMNVATVSDNNWKTKYLHRKKEHRAGGQEWKRINGINMDLRFSICHETIYGYFPIQYLIDTIYNENRLYACSLFTFLSFKFNAHSHFLSPLFSLTHVQQISFFSTFAAHIIYFLHFFYRHYTYRNESEKIPSITAIKQQLLLWKEALKKK